MQTCWCGTSFSFGLCPTCERNRLAREQNELLQRQMRQAEELARRVRYDQTHPDVPGPRYVSPRDTGPVVETPEPVRNRFWVIMSGIAMIMFGCTFFSLISIPLILFGIGWIFLG